MEKKHPKVFGLLFQDEMALANIQGRKIETSRANTRGIKPGDWFYQKEAWCWTTCEYIFPYRWRADGFDIHPVGGWKPSIHMPAAAARFWGEVIHVSEPSLLSSRSYRSHEREGFPLPDRTGFLEYVAKLKKMPVHDVLKLEMAAIVYKAHRTAPEWWDEYLAGVRSRRKRNG